MVHDVIAASMITEQVHRKEGKEKSGRLTVPTLRACHAAFPAFGTAVDFFTGAILSSSSPFRMAVINVSMTAEILSIYVQRITMLLTVTSFVLIRARVLSNANRGSMETTSAYARPAFSH
jgi:hypothetical protein